MALDASKNLLSSLIAVAPSPASSGLSLGVTAGTGSSFVYPANYAVWPAGAAQTAANTEFVRVAVAPVGDTLAILRVQEGSTARAIVVGDQIALAPTAKMFADIQAAISGASASIDGGSPSSTYLPAQQIDGGTP